MGQYYHPINLDKKQSLCSHDYDNGLKLMEHSWIGNNFVNTIAQLIAEGGAWFGDRIVWAGDYADPEVDENGNTIQEEYEGRKYDVTLYSMYGNDEHKIKPRFTGKMPKFRYVVNLDTKEFIDMRKVPLDRDGWQIHPLPLMTCEGNGRGGGDYHGESPLIGSWARKRITVTTRKPRRYKEIIFDLKE